MKYACLFLDGPMEGIFFETNQVMKIYRFSIVRKIRKCPVGIEGIDIPLDLVSYRFSSRSKSKEAPIFLFKLERRG